MNNGAASKDVVWLGHSGLLIDGPLRIYIDPFDVGPDLPKADLILLTHAHFDHCSEKDVARLTKDDTVIVGPKECVDRFERERVALAPGGSFKIKDVEVRAISAYSPQIPYHPKAKGWVGYWLDLGGRRLYHAGDTLLIPEMDELAGQVDVAFLPVDRVFTMNAFQAAAVVERIRPALAVPIHYGSFCGSKSEAARFVQECAGRGLKADFMPCAARGREDLPVPAVAPALPAAA